MIILRASAPTHPTIPRGHVDTQTNTGALFCHEHTHTQTHLSLLIRERESIPLGATHTHEKSEQLRPHFLYPEAEESVSQQIEH